MTIKYILTPLVLLLIPIIAIAYGELESGIYHSEDDYYYKYDINSNNQHIAMRIYYIKDDYGGTVRDSFQVPSWTSNLEIWMNSGLISYGEHQRAFDWLVKKQIEDWEKGYN